MNNITPEDSNRIEDPQVTVWAVVKEGRDGKTDLIVFPIRFLPFVELTCIVPIPDEDRDKVRVYVKYRLSPFLTVDARDFMTGLLKRIAAK